MSFQLRTATEDDAQAISDIYNHYVLTSTCTFDLEPEPIDRRVDWMKARGPGSIYPAIVCTRDEAIVGWGSLSPWNPRPAYSRTAEVSIYVHHEWHRNGIGRALLTELIDRARKLGHHVLIAGTCTEQVASLRLQDGFGFTRVGHFKEVGYKFDRWLDVCYSQMTLVPRHAAPPDAQ